MRKKVIDLRSDLMAQPSQEMWEAMRSAQPGWVVDREDPQVIQLEQMAAELTGKEAALFVATGRMAGLLAIMTCCGRGHQLILGEQSHLVWCEEWGLSYVAGAYPRLIRERDGKMDPGELEAAILESRFSHVPVTDLVCIENTHNGSGGRVVSLGLTEALCEVAHRHGARVYIDGARILYAAAAQGISVKELVAPADLIVFSLLKGLGAPLGAMLCAPAKVIDEAFINLRRIGGHAVHRAGIFAAAGIVALESGIDQLGKDIVRAQEFARAVSRIGGLGVDPAAVETNIVMVDVGGTGLDSREFLKLLYQHGVRGHPYTDQIARFTFHPQIRDADLEHTLEAMRSVAAEAPGGRQSPSPA